MTHLRRIFTFCLSLILASGIMFSCTLGDSELFQKPVEVFKVVDGFKFAEGPAVNSLGELYFTDIPNDKIYKWTPGGGLQVVRENTAYGNGLYFNQDDELFCCEMNARRLTWMNRSGEIHVLTDNYKGKKYNKPNDLWIHPDGGIYFTDPSYYMKKEDIEQDAEAVYYIQPGWESAKRVTGHITRPNGIIGTADGKTLYVVSDTAHQTWKFDIREDGSLGNKTLFVENGHDGLTLDERGNLYIANRDSLSVDIYNPQGKFLDRIIYPEPPSNVCFGGSEKNILYATAVSAVYGVKMNVSGQ